MNLCDQGHQTTEEVRLLPTGGDGNSLVCHKHYLEEMAFRRDRINAGAEGFKLPKWEDLKVYAKAINS